MEIWKNIEEYEGRFQVSNLGRVKSMNYRNTGKEKLLPIRETNGYPCVYFKYKGKVYSKFVHRLVAEAFIPNPDNKPHVDHINTDKSDNRVENLRWCTREENMNNPLTRDKLACFYSNHNYGKPVVQFTSNDRFVKVYPNAKSTGIFHVSRCCKGERKTAGGYKWKYLSDIQLLGDLAIVGRLTA